MRKKTKTLLRDEFQNVAKSNFELTQDFLSFSNDSARSPSDPSFRQVIMIVQGTSSFMIHGMSRSSEFWPVITFIADVMQNTFQTKKTKISISMQHVSKHSKFQMRPQMSLNERQCLPEICRKEFKSQNENSLYHLKTSTRFHQSAPEQR